MQAILYHRVSTKEQGTSRNGLEAQEAACRAFCEAQGWPVLGTYTDVASGALAPTLRPGLSSAWAQARKARATVVVAKLDRLSRDEAVIHTLAGDRAVPFVTAEDGLDLDPMMLSLKAMFAQRERVMIGQRTRAALQAKKARGEPLGSALHRDRAGTQARAVAASTAANRASADAYAALVAPTLRALQAGGRTMTQVAEEANKAKLPTMRGGQWHASSVCNTLKRAGT